MADNKLTLQDCCKYPNAKINYYSHIQSLVARFINISEFIALRKFDAEDDIADCKLTLRDISQLTDEERKHIDRLACINPITVRSNLKKSVLLIRYVIYESKELDYAIMKDDLQICDYLRSINIDIDDYLLSGKAVKG